MTEPQPSESGGDLSSSLPPIQLREHTTDGSDIDARTAPYWVRGRDHESAIILRKLANLPCAISVIAGSPGSGKSSMLTHLKAHLNYLGINTVELDTSDFNSETELTDALLKIRSPAKATAEAGETERGAALAFNIKVIQAEIGRMRRETRSHNRTLTWKHGLDALGQGKGTVILIDEAQRLESLRGDKPRQELLQNLMNALHSSHMRHQDRKLSLIACGLSHTQDVLNSFDMTRVENEHVIRMGPLSNQASELVLRDYATATPVEGGTLPEPPDELISELVGSCGGCPHHLAWAGCRLQQRARMIKQRAGAQQPEWSEVDITTVRREAARARTGLYGSRLGSAENQQRARALALTLATAADSKGPALAEDLVMALNGHLAKPEGAAAEPNPLRTLTHKGALERRENGHRFPTLDEAKATATHYAFPIPSMEQWLRETVQEEDGAQWKRSDSEAAIAAVAAQLADSANIAEWQWNYANDLGGIPNKMALPENGINAVQRERPKAVPNDREGIVQGVKRLVRRLFNRAGSSPHKATSGIESQQAPQKTSTPDS